MRVDRRFVALFVVVFVDLIGFGMVIPVLLLHAQETFGATDLQATLLLTSYSIGLVLAGPVLGRLSDAVGRRPVLILSQFGTLAGFLILGFANTLILLYLGRIIDGISGGNITTAQAYINDITTEKNRARGFGLISAAFGAGFIVGPALTALIVSATAASPALAPYSQNAPFFVAAIFSLTSILLTTFLLPESLPKEERAPLSRSREKVPGQKGLLDVIRLPDVRAILLFTILTFLAFSLLQASFAFFARRNLFSDVPLENAQRDIGLLLTWIGVVSVITQFVFVGRLVKRFGERRLVNVAALARVFAYVGIAFSRDPLTMALVFIPFAAANAISQPSLQSILSRFSPPEMRGRVLGAFQSSNSLTLVIGPILTGILLQLNLPSLSPETAVALPMFMGAIIMAIAFLMSFRVLRMNLPTQEFAKMQPAAAPAD
ncbi:MAG: tetracycline resistance MFS efflux pump [Anaerolineae bacterium]|nr:MAG: tetracycline resistance MFS efflux pump [Anaerolineae bacterium]